MVITYKPTNAFEKIPIDIIGLVPKTKSSSLYILTIQNDFTEYSFSNTSSQSSI